jgi:hypothetical protein
MAMGRLLLAVGALSILGAGASASAEGLAPEHEALTPHYRMVLQIGPAEAMYTAAEAHAHHAASGEIMVGGKMAGGMEHEHDGMAMPERRHVELHVFSRATGRVVVDAHVTIAIAGADNTWTSVPIARMYGIEPGPDDMHFGNNMSLPPGSYKVRVSVNGERARFALALD